MDVQQESSDIPMDVEYELSNSTEVIKCNDQERDIHNSSDEAEEDSFEAKNNNEEEGPSKPDDEKTLDHYIDEETWLEIGKRLEDYSEEDMKKLSFKSLAVCEEFYFIYSKIKGFGVRRKGGRKSRIDGHLTSRAYVCNKEGERNEDLYVSTKQRIPKALTRCNCKAEIRFKLDEETKLWFVTKFLAEHTHDLVDPKHVPYVRSHRKISDADKIRNSQMYKSGISQSGIMRNMVQTAGSHEEVGFLKGDVYNYVERIKREDIRDGDAETVMAYLFGKQNVDPSFFVRYTQDEEGRLQMLFWCDGISRTDYKTFGHVIAFDTTYKSNAYNKPFVVIVGINHHRKTVPFGCALVVNEKENSFVWVLEQLIEAGDGKMPLTVVTDGDKAMANAIKVVLPEARHRLCLWHIMQNVKTRGGSRFASGFMKCVDKYRMPEDFEKAWKELVAYHKLEQKKWVLDLYADKEKWAEAYLRGYFFAGMRSTQRCESMHKTVKRVLDQKIMLYRFVELYDQVLAEIRFNEGNFDYTSIHTFPVIEGVLYNIKCHAARVYTRNSYVILCKEISFEAMYIVREVKPSNSDDLQEPIYYWLDEVDQKDVRYIVIRYDKLKTMYCCCMKLESVGYPCRHMFAVMKHAKMAEIPSGCILERWAIHAKEDTNLNKTMDQFEGGDASVKMARFAYLNSFSAKLTHIASRTFEGFKNLRDAFAKLMIDMAQDDFQRKIPNSQKELLGLGDPEVVSGRGKPQKQKTQGCNKRHQPGPPRRTCQNKENIQVASTEDKVETETNDNRLQQSTTKFDLNETPVVTPQPSPAKASKMDQTSDSPAKPSVLMKYMPSKFTSGEMSQATRLKLDKNPLVFDWNSKVDW